MTHAEQIAAWKAAHPERLQELNRKARRAYRDRRRRLAERAQEIASEEIDTTEDN